MWTELIKRVGTTLPTIVAGGLMASTAVAQPSGVNCPQEFAIDFSLDIGSDTELSDPNMDGDELHDPGDVYFALGGPMVPAGFIGYDGYLDDAFIFGGTDPIPDPPMLAGGAVVPVGVMCPPDDCYRRHFDLDGHDRICTDLRQYIPNHPLEVPIPTFQSACIFPPEHLIISYDDDRGLGWPGGDVPVTAPSMTGVSSYGTTAGKDEVIALTLTPGPIPSPIAGIAPYLSERALHADLAPNPDATEKDDDDVDSLDVVAHIIDLPASPDGVPGGIDPCPYWYFTADHEAVSPASLDPGSIYLTTGAAVPTKVIDDVIHLGIPETTDVDAFEFTWLRTTQGSPALAILFSVDNDDPLTPGDESGGLSPRVIYASFMTGFSFPLTDPDDERIKDDIDAIAIWCSPFEPPPEPCTAPVVVSAVSRLTHGAAGDFDIDVFAGEVEHRVDAPKTLIIRFDQPVVVCDCTLDVNAPGSEVGTSHGTATASLAGDTLTIDITGVPTVASFTVRLSGFCCLPDHVAMTPYTFKFCVLTGDVTGDGVVNIVDLNTAKGDLFAAVTAANFRSDVTGDGIINIVDLNAIKRNLFSTCP